MAHIYKVNVCQISNHFMTSVGNFAFKENIFSIRSLWRQPFIFRHVRSCFSLVQYAWNVVFFSHATNSSIHIEPSREKQFVADAIRYMRNRDDSMLHILSRFLCHCKAYNDWTFERSIYYKFVFCRVHIKTKKLWSNRVLLTLEKKKKIVFKRNLFNLSLQFTAFVKNRTWKM